jgi:Zn finger protein HypA/HybF involved in hydrogenase expression
MAEPLVTIEQYQFLPEAASVRMHLESEGIEAYLADAETVSTDWALGNAIGYIKLQVREPQVEAAMTILDQLRARRAARNALPNAREEFRCLACEVELLPDQRSCPKCGWSYGDADDDRDDGDESKGPTEATSSSAENETKEPDSVLDSLRSLKHSVFVIWLAPFLVGIVLSAAWVLLWIIQSLFGE